MNKGQIVIALGNPYAIARDGQASASWGIVANLQRKSAPTPGENGLAVRPTLHHFGTLIQTDAKLNLGTSGGALVNLKGEMVGLTTSLAAVAGYEQAAGYAIPVDNAFRETVDKLKEGEERTHGLLGIQFRRDEPFPIAGVRVDMIYPAGPARQADIRPNDIITHVDDQVIHDGDDLMLNIGRLPAGRHAHITLERNGRVLQRDVMLAKFPVQGKTIITKPAPSWRGLTVDYATALLEYQSRVNSGDAPLEALRHRPRCRRREPRVVRRAAPRDSYQPRWQCEGGNARRIRAGGRRQRGRRRAAAGVRPDEKRDGHHSGGSAPE